MSKRESVRRTKTNGSDEGRVEYPHSLPFIPVQQSNPANSPLANKLDELDLNDLIVEIRNLKFTYDSKKGLLMNDINMSFPRSAIYGFLGPSGCGKTTLIKLIVGRLKPESGTIKINGKEVNHPSNKIPGVGIGYMPQDYAIYREFTIMETLNYFAQIYGLSKDFKKKRIDFLINFLELPDPNRLVEVLSGGQKRRMSLSIALIHNPPFLVLDEPTVGVDPMLRDRVWEHLLYLSSEEKTSVLLTTHYIEECRRAHVIALMRGGKLLVENSPTNLLMHFKTDNLEDVFLQVSRYDERADSAPMPPTVAHIRQKSIKPVTAAKEVVTPETKSTFFNRLSALIHKNVMRLWRQKLLLAIILFLPSLTMILFCVCIGKKPHDLDIAVFNGEVNGNKGNTSLYFLNQIDKKTIKLNDYKTEEEAKDSVSNGKTYGALIVDGNFTAALRDRSLAVNFQVSNRVIEQSSIKFYGDLTNLMIFAPVYQTLIEAEMKFQTDMIKSSGANVSEDNRPNPRAILPLIEFVDPPVYGSLNPTFRDFATPGLILIIVFVLCMAVLALNLVKERKEGLLDRTLVTGVKIYEVLLAEIIVQFMVLLLQFFLLMFVVIVIFHINIEGSLALVVLLALLQGICGMAFGLLISGVSKNEEMAAILVIGCLVPLLVISGILWPLEGMHYILRTIALFTPQTLPVISLRNIMLKGWGLSYTLVWAGFLVTIFWTIVFFIATTIITSLRSD